MKRNAIGNVNSSLCDLKEAKAKLDNAVSTVEKEENKQMIEDSLQALGESIEQVECTIKNYHEK